MVKIFLDEYICTIERKGKPWFVHMIFWKHWATDFQCSANELRDVYVKRRYGIRTLVITTDRKKVPLYLGVGAAETKRIMNLVLERCYKNPM